MALFTFDTVSCTSRETKKDETQNSSNSLNTDIRDRTRSLNTDSTDRVRSYSYHGVRKEKHATDSNDNTMISESDIVIKVEDCSDDNNDETSDLLDHDMDDGQNNLRPGSLP